MELIFVFAVIRIEIVLVDFVKIVEIVRTFGIDTFMYAEEFTVFLGSQGIATVRACKPDRGGGNIAGRESLTADLALVLPVSTIVIVDKMMRRSAQRTDSIFGKGFTIATLNRLNRFAIFPLIVFEEKLPVLFDESFDNREFIYFEFLVFWGMGIIKSPLFERDISADKI